MPVRLVCPTMVQSSVDWVISGFGWEKVMVGKGGYAHACPGGLHFLWGMLSGRLVNDDGVGDGVDRHGEVGHRAHFGDGRLLLRGHRGVRR